MNQKYEFDLTIFIITCGEESVRDCLKAIESQKTEKINIKTEIIEGIYPMSEAFNQMHLRAQSPYFVQVDADMILKENAINTLYKAIKKTNFLTYVVYGQLYEEGFGIGGSIRCWKKSFFKWFQFRDRRTVDRDLYKRAKFLGLKRKNINKELGIHRPRHSPFSEYLKAKSDVEKWRYLRRPPTRYARALLYSFLKERKLYNLLGFLLGNLTGSARLNSSKDIFIERKRYYKIRELLGYKKEQELLFDLDYINIKQLENLFEENYRDLHTTNQNARNKLIQFIIKIFAPDKTKANIKEFDKAVKH